MRRPLNWHSVPLHPTPEKTPKNAIFLAHLEKKVQKGEARAKYSETLLVNLSKDLTRLRGRGFSRSNLSYIRKFYLAFPKCETVSHK